jgi:cation diffusion facilitator family transporter
MAPVYREASQAALLGLVVNLGLGLTKLAGGLVGDSFALLADAVNSLGDVFTSGVVLFALWLAQRPPDREHPYGHTRAEAIAASNVALLIFLSALTVAWEAMQHLTVQHDLPPAWTLWIAAANVAIKETLYQYKVRVARRTGSAVILANAWDHRSDALSALAVLIGLAVVRGGGPDFIWADEVAALVVMAAILWSSASLFRKSVYELMDVQADKELVQEVRRTAQEVPGVRGIEKLWVRKTGLEYLVDIHVEVDRLAPVEEGHRIGHLVKDQLLQRFPSVRDVLVHLEPHAPRAG